MVGITKRMPDNGSWMGQEFVRAEVTNPLKAFDFSPYWANDVTIPEVRHVQEGWLIWLGRSWPTAGEVERAISWYRWAFGSRPTAIHTFTSQFGYDGEFRGIPVRGKIDPRVSATNQGLI